MPVLLGSTPFCLLPASSTPRDAPRSFPPCSGHHPSLGASCLLQQHGGAAASQFVMLWSLWCCKGMYAKQSLVRIGPHKLSLFQLILVPYNDTFLQIMIDPLNPFWVLILCSFTSSMAYALEPFQALCVFSSFPPLPCSSLSLWMVVKAGLKLTVVNSCFIL